ncbi:hypothetical protein MMC11_000610 [Xylographa trunciseda]|nr:hypothetical protein [Xylographa trunciseda]
MPLSEISVNSVGRAGKTPDSPVMSIINAYADNRSDVSAPSSIQSMLKNTTETGDIGTFSINPSSIAYPLSRASSRSSSLPYFPGGLPQHQLNQLVGNGHQRHRRVVNSRQNSLQSLHGTTTSSIISMYRTESRNSFRPHTSHAQQVDQRALSMSQSSQLSYNLSNHRPNGVFRPRSPFAYPTRLKRPGYRPSSPALMDFIGTDARTPFGLDKSASFRTPSPLSAPPYRRGPAVYPSNLNRSMPSLQRCTSPLSRPLSRSSIAPPMPSQSNGQRSSSNKSNWLANQDDQRELSNGGSRLRQPSPSLASQYYDYSEAFVEQQKQYDSTTPILSSAEQITPEVKDQQLRAQEVVRKPITINTKPVSQEIPAQDDVCKQAQIKSDPVLESPSPVAAPGKFLQRMGEWENEQVYFSGSPQDKPNNEKAKENYRVKPTEATIDDNQAQDTVELPTIRDTFGHHILSSSKPGARDRFVRDSRRSISPGAAQPINSSHNGSGLDDVRALEIIAGRSKDTQEILPTMPLTADEQPPLMPWYIPSLDLGYPHFETRTPDLTELSHQRWKSPSHVKETQSPSIRAPVPERSMSSRTNKDRFSRIFSIDESFDDLDRAVEESGQDKVLLESVAALGPSRKEHSGWSGKSYTSPSESTEISLEPISCVDSVKVLDGLPVSKRLREECSQADSSDNVPHSYGSSRASTKILKSSEVVTGSTVNYSKPEAAEEKEARHVLTGNSQHRESSSEFLNPPKDCSTSTNINIPSQACAMNEPVQELPIMPQLEAASVVPWEYGVPKDGESFPIGRYRLKSKAEKESERRLTSAPSSGSRNPQASHSRSGPSNNSEPSIMRSSHDSPNPTGKAPRFKLKITRASSSTNGTVRIRRQTSLTSSPRPSFAIGPDFFRAGPFARKSKSEDHSDGSHDSKPTVGYMPFPTHAHFKEQLDNSAMSANQSGLRPPSSNQNNTEVQSFFSDDSSNMEQRGGLRQRISQLKAIASRGNSTDDLRVSIRPQATKGDSRPQSGCNGVENHGATKGMSTLKYKTWKIRQKIRSWWHHGEGKLKGLGGKVKKRSRRKRSMSTELYPGV